MDIKQEEQKMQAVPKSQKDQQGRRLKHSWRKAAQKIISFHEGQDFSQMVNRPYRVFVDKTMFLFQFWTRNFSSSIMILRPRKFGKSTIMSMTDYFFRKCIDNNGNEEINKFKCLFENSQLWKHQKKFIDQHQGQYPVISMDWKNISVENQQQFLNQFASEMGQLCICHFLYLFQFIENKQPNYSLQFDLFKKLINLEKIPKDLLLQSLQILCRMLFIYHNKKVILLIDEFDRPVTKMFYSLKSSLHQINNVVQDITKILLFIKGNRHIQSTILTGIYDILPSDEFSGLNNIQTFDMTSSIYALYFGFTKKQIKGMIDQIFIYSNKENKDQREKHVQNMIEEEKIMEAISYLYNGYQLNNSQPIYNPIDIKKYLAHYIYANRHEPRSYWLETGSDAFFTQMFQLLKKNLQSRIEKIIYSNQQLQFLFKSKIDFGSFDLSKPLEESKVIYLLLSSGYLTGKHIQVEGNDILKARIPNRQIKKKFCAEFIPWFRQQMQNENIINSVLQQKWNNIRIQDSKEVKEFVLQEMRRRHKNYLWNNEQFLAMIFVFVLFNNYRHSLRLQVPVKWGIINQAYYPNSNSYESDRNFIIHEYKYIYDPLEISCEQKKIDVLWQIYKNNYISVGLQSSAKEIILRSIMIINKPVLTFPFLLEFSRDQIHSLQDVPRICNYMASMREKDKLNQEKIKFRKLYEAKEKSPIMCLVQEEQMIEQKQRQEQRKNEKPEPQEKNKKKKTLTGEILKKEIKMEEYNPSKSRKTDIIIRQELQKIFYKSQLEQDPEEPSYIFDYQTVGQQLPYVGSAWVKKCDQQSTASLFKAKFNDGKNLYNCKLEDITKIKGLGGNSIKAQKIFSKLQQLKKIQKYLKIDIQSKKK